MNIDEEKYHRVERYLRNQLSSEERETFEKDLDTDSDLANALDLIHEADNLIKVFTLQEMEESVKVEIDKAEASRNKQVRNSGLKGGLIILFLALSALVTFIIFGKINKRREVSELEPVTTITVSKQKVDSLKGMDLENNLSEVKRPERVSPVVKSRLDKKNSVKPEYNWKTPVVPDHVSVSPDINKNNQSFMGSKDTRDAAGASETALATHKGSKVVACDEIDITADIATVSTCKGKTAGSIQITGIKGGKTPYRIFVNDTDYDSKTSFTGLAEGQYSILLQDSFLCSRQFSVDVKGIDCLEPEAAFAPGQGQVFVFPLAEGQSGGVATVYSADGKVIFSGNIVPGDSWSGTDQYGNTVPADSYFYVIDLPENEKKSGYVTIIR